MEKKPDESPAIQPDMLEEPTPPPVEVAAEPVEAMTAETATGPPMVITQSPVTAPPSMAKRESAWPDQIMTRSPLPATRKPNGGARRAITAKESEACAKEFDDECFEILPTGAVYLPQVHVRLRLNRVFGAGVWYLHECGDDYEFDPNKNVLSRRFELYIRGARAGVGQGEQPHFEDSWRSTKSTVIEGVRSNGLVRACKDISIGWQAWDKNFQRRFIREQCLAIYCEVWKKNKDKKWEKRHIIQYRRTDQDPLTNRDGENIERPDYTPPEGGDRSGNGGTEYRQPQRKSEKKKEETTGKPKAEKQFAGKTPDPDVESVVDKMVLFETCEKVDDAFVLKASDETTGDYYWTKSKEIADFACGLPSSSDVVVPKPVDVLRDPIKDDIGFKIFMVQRARDAS